ncbi:MULTISPECIES: helix-turn-helix domain-containing protein [Thalassospira]|jgi:AraC-like DNA-binding protein|nr:MULTISPECIES: helix-turn-helix domain-containing protein [Thalassospira]MBL4842904.1 AraC family transcriptional regulator [Thalassospira sp.]MDM7977941.1 helix-turn-helix domain-containing protein [Thalassospira xiamenensis]OCK10138.1 transcriptional regulator with only HTH domain, AraC family [Thalassospira sp. KO164]OHZ03545.1 AraC family transcriptional regulator [Thalassospira sp. MIT1004]PXX27029.1 AraC-like DNA-binding protein [Thalassospira sp. 11-3]|tara:strand:+ start:762 stop:1955 length:1194 start_codon:yes stop_codon:yes gene_type:complete
MLEPIDLLLLLISALGAAQTIFLVVLLRGEGRRAFRANRWLMIFAVAVGMSFADDIIDTMVSPLVNLYLAPVFTPFYFAFIPAIYLYFLEISGKPSARPTWHFAVMLPVSVVMMGVVYLLGPDTSLSGVTIEEINVDLDFRLGKIFNMLLILLIMTFCLQFASYMFRIWRVVVRYLQDVSRQLEVDRKGLRRWVQELLVGLSVIFTLFTLINLFDTIVSRSEWLQLGVKATFVLVFFRMCHVIAVNPALFVQPERDEVENTRESDEKKPRSGLVRSVVDPNDVSRIRAKLDRIVAARELMFDPLLTMPKLANAVGVTPNQLSYVLNQHLGKSFFDFVNEVRTYEASRLLIEEADRTILDIAISVGFNSKSTFNLAFKKIIGKTPSAYRDENSLNTNT